MPYVSHYLSSLREYASKAISLAAKADTRILNLSIGEPAFGPPSHLTPEIMTDDLTLECFIHSVKAYECSQGSPTLREAIAKWYLRRYNHVVNPDTEVMVTHGAVEALSLVILATTDPGDAIAISDPTYMLYGRVIENLSRTAVSFRRQVATDEYATSLESRSNAQRTFRNVKAMIVNSPENPTGYIASPRDWEVLSSLAEDMDLWIIHDEVYDTMSFTRAHRPARAMPSMADRAILINSCSKKYGTPGLRIGWIVADAALIQCCKKAHDNLCLGVNALAERIASRLINDPQSDQWLQHNSDMLKERVLYAMQLLSREAGFQWDRAPMGGMFLFPNIAHMYERLPLEYRDMKHTISDATAEYLLKAQYIAVVPGSVYGESAVNHIRLTTGGDACVYRSAIERLSNAIFF